MNTSSKPTAIIYGNCVADVICSMLKSEPGFSDNYTVKYVRSFTHPVDGPSHIDKDDLHHCRILIEQRGPFQRAPFLDQLPEECRRISFPMLQAGFLWPFQVFDGLNPEIDAGFPFGRFPYGDRHVRALVCQGIAPADIPRHYLDHYPYAESDLDGCLAKNLEIGRELDRQCSVSCYEFIASSFRHERLFWTPNHPTGSTLAFLIESLFAALHLDPRSQDRVLSIVKQDPLHRNHLPLHPCVISHFNLTWAKPDMRYLYHDREWLSFNEYFERYAQYLVEQSCPAMGGL